eukprot:scaffold153742_cov32-Tisochrysis_lutea.AAC.1
MHALLVSAPSPANAPHSHKQGPASTGRKKKNTARRGYRLLIVCMRLCAANELRASRFKIQLSGVPPNFRRASRRFPSVPS